VANWSNNLPALLPSLIGRTEALADLRGQLLEAERGVLTLTGTGGSGKTRLALAVACEVADWTGFPDGVWLAELAPVGDPSLAPAAVAASVGVKEQAGRPIRDTLLEELRSRSLLLILDNCEHIVDACAALTDELLRNCPGLRILATSREPLRIPGERVWRVPPLSAPDARATLKVEELARNPAVQLFVERGQAVQSALTLTAETSQAIARICARLDGLPLAIELAAARARVLSPDQILARLDDAFRLLVGGSRTAATRQQTLRATLDWSYRLLSPAERTRFERLAVFAGGFDLDSAEAIWSADERAGGADALEMLTGLVDRSLVTAQPVAGAMRYRLLEPVRQYAEQWLTERGDWEATRRAHADYFLRLAEQGEAGLKGADAHAWEARLKVENDNLRAVLRRSIDHGEPEAPLRICSALRNFWLQYGFRNEGRRWLEEALAGGWAEVPAAVRANAVFSAGVLASATGDFRASRAWFEHAAECWRGLGDRAGLGTALTYMGRIVASTAETPAEYELGKAVLREAIALSRERGAWWWAANGLLFLGIAAWEHAEPELAATTLREAEAINAQLGDTHAQSHLRSKLGGVLCDQGDLVGSQQLIEQSLAEARAIDCLAGACQALYYLAGLRRMQGDLIGAARQGVECLRLAHQVSDEVQANCTELLGGLACELGQPERTATLYGAAASLRQTTGLPMPPILRPVYERDLAAARGTIGSRRFASAWAAGSAMKFERVVEYAHEIEVASWPRAASSTGPLSPREREVIALLARGCTNRQIAEALIISGRTADGHVAHILAKLGLSTRAQAAVWAVEHALAGTPDGRLRVADPDIC